MRKTPSDASMHPRLVLQGIYEVVYVYAGEFYITNAIHNIHYNKIPVCTTSQ